MQSREMDPNRGRSGRVRLQLESLEDRCCPSSILFRGHTLLISDDNTSNVVTIRDGGHGNVTATVVNGAGHRSTVSARGVQKIQVQSQGGSDRIDYALTATLTTSEQLVFNLGKESNQLSLNFAKGIAAPRLNVQVNDGSGDDPVTAVFGAIRGTQLNFQTWLGKGFNHFQAQMNGDLTNSARVSLNVQGGQSFDGIAITSHANVAAGSGLSLQTNGGGGKDTVHLNYTGRIDGTLLVNANGGIGDAWLESNVWVAPGSRGNLTAKVYGGSGHDLLVLKVHDQGTHLRSLKTLIDGGNSGDSQAIRTANVAVVRCQL
jgi:hypothetical protein